MENKKENRLVYAVILAALFLAGGIILFTIGRPSEVLIMGGSFLASDAGRSHGGFEYVAEWNATLTISGGSGSLGLVLAIGLGDALLRHEYRVTEFTRDQNAASMKIDGQPVVMSWIRNDTIWNHEFDNYYIASWGGDAPPEELRGSISPEIFPGLASHYYVELRLR